MSAILRGVIFVPYLIFGLVAGALIDIFHRKNILLICSICQGVLFLSVFILTVTNIITFPLLVVVMFLNGIFTTFYNIAIPSFLPEIVTDKDNLKKRKCSTSTFRVSFYSNWSYASWNRHYSSWINRFIHC